MIEFPALGLQFNINPVALQVGPITVYWYGVIIAFGFMLAVFLAMRASKDYGVDPENIIDLVLFAAPVSIIFARLYYVVFKWEDYRSDLSEIYKIWHGGIAIYGAVIGALLSAWLFARYKKISPLNLFDLGVPYLILAQAIGRWGNFVNQEAFGVNTALPWGMTSNRIRSELGNLQAQGMNVDPSLPVHPTFLYESLWNLAAFFVLIYFSKRRKVEGEVFFLYMILYGAGRFWIEGLRTDSLMLGNFRISQVLALVLAVVFAVIFFVRRKKLREQSEEAGVIRGTSEYGEVLKQLNENEAENEAVNTSEAADEASEAAEKDPSAEEEPETANNEEKNETNQAEPNEEVKQ